MIKIAKVGPIKKYMTEFATTEVTLPLNFMRSNATGTRKNAVDVETTSNQDILLV